MRPRKPDDAVVPPSEAKGWIFDGTTARGGGAVTVNLPLGVESMKPPGMTDAYLRYLFLFVFVSLITDGQFEWQPDSSDVAMAAKTPIPLVLYRAGLRGFNI